MAHMGAAPDVELTDMDPVDRDFNDRMFAALNNDRIKLRAIFSASLVSRATS